MDGEHALGSAAAELLEKIERNYGENARIADGLVLAEVHYVDEDGDVCSTVEWYSTSDRASIREGLLSWAYKTNLIRVTE